MFWCSVQGSIQQALLFYSLFFIPFFLHSWNDRERFFDRMQGLVFCLKRCCEEWTQTVCVIFKPCNIFQSILLVSYHAKNSSRVSLLEILLLFSNSHFWFIKMIFSLIQLLFVSFHHSFLLSFHYPRNYLLDIIIFSFLLLSSEETDQIIFSFLLLSSEETDQYIQMMVILFECVYP